jgi:hypothetical protein
MTYSSRFLRSLTRLAVLAAMLVLICGITGWAQTPPQSLPAPLGGQQDDNQQWKIEKQRDMAKKRNVERQEDIKKDTDQLLKLATELKQYVDKTNENTLSIEVIKKAEEIEKLAHDVREKMKGQ